MQTAEFLRLGLAQYTSNLLELIQAAGCDVSKENILRVGRGVPMYREDAFDKEWRASSAWMDCMIAAGGDAKNPPPCVLYFSDEFLNIDTQGKRLLVQAFLGVAEALLDFQDRQSVQPSAVVTKTP